MEDKRYKIIIVDDNALNLTMARNMLRTSYEVFPALSAIILFEILEKVTPDLIMLDIEMPSVNGYEAFKQLKADERVADVPVIFLTAKNDVGSELTGLGLGAVDYIHKPFSGPLLLKRIESQILISEQKRALKEYNLRLEQMVREKTDEIIELQNAVLSAVSVLVSFRDESTGNHIARTQKYLGIMIDAMREQGLYADITGAWNTDVLLPSSQLYDVGKIAIPDFILNKPGKLTPGEFNVMKKHTTVGVDAIDRISDSSHQHDFLRYARIIAGSHHEKWDGSGYPDGLAGDDIPLIGRIMAIVDVYDALTSVRPYKIPLSAKEAESIIISGQGTHFDPQLVDIFIKVAPEFAKVVEQTDA